MSTFQSEHESLQTARQSANTLCRANAFSLNPEFRFYITILSSIVLYGIAASIGSGWIFFLSASLLGTMVAATIMPLLSLVSLSVKQTAPPRIQAGERCRTVFTLADKARFFRAKWLIARLLDGRKTARAAGEESSVALIESLSKGLSISFICGPWKRGIHRCPALRLESSYPFGLIWLARSWSNRNTIVVHPKPVTIEGRFLMRLKSDVYVPGGSSGGQHGFQSNTTKNIRNYIRGDSRRFIHWSLSAKHSQLMVREYEREGLPAFDVAIDCACPWESEEQLELAITTAASLLSMGHRTGVHPVLYILTTIVSDLSELPPHLADDVEQLDALAGIQFLVKKTAQTHNFTAAKAFQGRPRPLVLIQCRANQDNGQDHYATNCFQLRIIDPRNAANESTILSEEPPFNCLNIRSEADLEML